jgi:hypothetical protein
MITTQTFSYRCTNGTPSLIDTNTDSAQTPDELPDWPCTEDQGIIVIYIEQNDSSPIDATIKVDISPAIIKGWKIYKMHTTRITAGGMINDRQVTFYITKLEPTERRRIDILIKGPPGKIQIWPTRQ